MKTGLIRAGSAQQQESGKEGGGDGVGKERGKMSCCTKGLGEKSYSNSIGPAALPLQGWSGEWWGGEPFSIIKSEPPSQQSRFEITAAS